MSRATLLCGVLAALISASQASPIPGEAVGVHPAAEIEFMPNASFVPYGKAGNGGGCCGGMSVYTPLEGCCNDRALGTVIDEAHVIGVSEPQRTGGATIVSRTYKPKPVAQQQHEAPNIIKKKVYVKVPIEVDQVVGSYQWDTQAPGGHTITQSAQSYGDRPKGTRYGLGRAYRHRIGVVDNDGMSGGCCGNGCCGGCCGGGGGIGMHPASILPVNHA